MRDIQKEPGCGPQSLLFSCTLGNTELIHTEVASMSFLKKPFRKLKEINNNSSPDNTSTDSIPSKTEGISNSVSPATNGVTENEKGIGINGNDPKENSNGNSVTNKARSIAVAFVPNGKTKTNGSGASTPERSNSRRQSHEILDQERKRRSVDKERVKAENKKRESMARIEDERFLQEGPPQLTKLYRPYSMIMSKRWNSDDRLLFKNIKWEGKWNMLALNASTADDHLEFEGKTITFRARIHTIRRLSAKLVFIVFRQQTITIQGVLQSFKAHDQVEGMFGLRVDSAY